MLEDYIQKNRDAFDQGKLPDGHSDRFANRLQGQQAKVLVIPVRRVWQVAAAILVLLVAIQAGSWFSTSPSSVAETSPQVVSELSDIDLYYGNLVRKESIELSGKWEQDEAMQFFLNDLDTLETEYNELKNSILIQGRNDYLINALIQNYQQRLSILEHISNIITQNKTNNEREQIQSS